MKKIISDDGHYDEANIIKDYGGVDRILIALSLRLSAGSLEEEAQATKQSPVTS
ncbi:MAG: hypothetical protein HYU98_07280 [Deltaproteobacteria bacterium]|nr:hypothetical protein [Deltaproteobacteria bacterium]